MHWQRLNAQNISQSIGMNDKKRKAIENKSGRKQNRVRGSCNLRTVVNVAMSSDVVNDIFFSLCVPFDLRLLFFTAYSIEYRLLTPIIPAHIYIELIKRRLLTKLNN